VAQVEEVDTTLQPQAQELLIKVTQVELVSETLPLYTEVVVVVVQVLLAQTQPQRLLGQVAQG
jgi:Na+/citrate or Na+/malate symporter